MQCKILATYLNGFHNASFLGWLYLLLLHIFRLLLLLYFAVTTFIFNQSFTKQMNKLGSKKKIDAVSTAYLEFSVFCQFAVITEKDVVSPSQFGAVQQDLGSVFVGEKKVVKRMIQTSAVREIYSGII